MSNSIDLLSEVLRDAKHPFRAVVDRPGKSQKHRYERRKARGCLRFGDWQPESVFPRSVEKQIPINYQ